MRLRFFLVTLTLALGCGHYANEAGHAASSMGHSAEHAGGEFARAAAPIATHVARELPEVARDAIIVARVRGEIATTDGIHDDHLGAVSDATDQVAGVPAPDPCSACAADETCYYVDYVCPATAPGAIR